MQARIHPFDQLVQRGEEQIRLAEAALLLARDHSPELDVGALIARLDAYADRLRPFDAQSAIEQISALRMVLFLDAGLSGKTGEKETQPSSLLHEVLQGKPGNYYSLAMIWLDVSQQLRWPLSIVHVADQVLMVRHDTEDLLIDPVHGRLLDRGQVERLASASSGNEVSLRSGDFPPVSKKEILTLALRQMRKQYAKADQWTSVLKVLRRLLALTPDSERLMREIKQTELLVARMN